MRSVGTAVGGGLPPYVVWARHVSAREVVAKVSAGLESLGIPFVLIKGIVTAHLLYGDPSERHLSDIDLRIRHGDFARAVRFARSRGWYKRPDVILWQALWKLDGWEVDVKSALGPPGLCAITSEMVLDRAERAVEPFGFPYLRPELNDHALILVLNAFKDGLRTTPWALEDLRRIVRHERFDANALVARARAGKVLSPLWLTADWLAAAHGAVEWRSVRDRVGPRPPSRRAAAVYGQWRKSGAPPKPGLFVTASSGDTPGRFAAGLTLAAAGVLEGRLLRMLYRTPRTQG